MIKRLMYRAEWQLGQESMGLKALEISQQARKLVEQGELMTAAA